MAAAIVDGVQAQSSSQVQLLHVNLLSQTGAQAARRWGVRIVPATVVVGPRGELIDRQVGLPNGTRVRSKIEAAQAVMRGR
jgi:hypothetical protein